MFPIRDHNPSERTPYVTWALIAINIVVFLSYFPTLSGTPDALLAYYETWGMVPERVSDGRGGAGIITHMFLHGGWMHLIGNMLFLWIFGDNLEDQMGHLPYLAFYVAGGLFAAGGQILADPSSDIPMVGASGAIAAVMGGYLLMFPRARIDVLVILVVIFKVFTIPAWLMLGVWFGLQLVSGVQMDAMGGGVAYWAHAGGFVAGVILALPLWLRLGGRGFWGATRGKPPHEEVEYRVDGRGRTGIPRVRRVRSAQVSDRAVADLSRIPKAGGRNRGNGGSRSPWSGGR